MNVDNFKYGQERICRNVQTFQRRKEFIFHQYGSGLIDKPEQPSGKTRSPREENKYLLLETIQITNQKLTNI